MGQLDGGYAEGSLAQADIGADRRINSRSMRLFLVFGTNQLMCTYRIASERLPLGLGQGWK